MAALRPSRRAEAGLTLTEVAVVMIIGTMIMAGIVGFYLASQGLWLDASTQAITQREASLVASAIRDSVRAADHAVAYQVPDLQHQELALYRSSDPTASPSYYFWWDASDSLIHAGSTIGGPGSGPMVMSHADRFQVTSGSQSVRVDLRLRSASGSPVDVGTLAVFMN